MVDLRPTGPLRPVWVRITVAEARDNNKDKDNRDFHRAGNVYSISLTTNQPAEHGQVQLPLFRTSTLKPAVHFRIIVFRFGKQEDNRRGTRQQACWGGFGSTSFIRDLKLNRHATAGTVLDLNATSIRSRGIYSFSLNPVVDTLYFIHITS